jgi:hypothetical protein
MVVGVAILAVGLVALLDVLAVNVRWGIVLPAGLILIGLFLLLNPGSGTGRGWMIVGGVLTVILLVGTFSDFSINVGTPDNIEQADFTVDETVDEIVVAIDAGSVEVVVGSGVGVRVERQLRFDDDRPDVSHSINDGRLLIEADCTGGFFGTACSVDHVLQVPASVDLEIDTSAGSVRVNGIQGVVDVETGSGSIELVDLSGSVIADSGAGGIVLDGLSGVSEAGTGSGGVRGTRLATPSLLVDTGSGSIDLQFETSPGELDVDAGSGSVTVVVPAGSYRLDLDTGSGSTDFSGITDDTGSDRTIRIRTGSGSIRVEGR